MKKAVSLLLSAALLLGLLSACGGPAGEPDPLQEEHAARELVDAALLSSGYDEESGDLEYLSTEEGGEEFLTAYLENAYDLQSPWRDAAVIRGTGASAFELAVLRMEDEGTAVRAASSLMSYIFSRQGDFAGYAPAEADMVANGEILQVGPYAALFICPNPQKASAAVEAALGGETLSGQPGGDEPLTDVKELRDFLMANQGIEAANLELLDDSDPETLSAYIKDAYGLTSEQWEACAVARGTEESGFEIAVIRVPDEWAALVENRLNSYLYDREETFQVPIDQASLLYGAIVVQAKPNVVLLACEDVLRAAEAFSEAAGTMGYSYSQRHRYLEVDPNYPDRCLFTPPHQDDMSLYDTSAIRAAWEEGNPSGLSREDRKIYEQAEKVLNEVVKDGMSDYEKELAVYAWVVNNVDYDWNHQDRMKTTPRESFTPYGGLVNHKAVCLGYATTFQLLMDLAGVECITVPGAAFSSREDHAWNMVRINAQWYCVDVTWDANYREQGGASHQEDWSYFNVTSDYMADTDHQWDYANTPEATAADRGQG